MINPALYNLINENQSRLWSLWWWQWVGVCGEPVVLIQFLSLKTAPKENNNIIMLFPQNLWLIREQNALVSQRTSHVVKVFCNTTCQTTCLWKQSSGTRAILLHLPPASLTHKNPQRHNIIHGVHPVGHKERWINLNFLVKYCVKTVKTYNIIFLTVHVSYGFLPGPSFFKTWIMLSNG